MRYIENEKVGEKKVKNDCNWLLIRELGGSNTRKKSLIIRVYSLTINKQSKWLF